MLQDLKSRVLGPVGIGVEYYPVGIKTHIEYPDIFFWKYNSPYHIEMGTYVLIDSLWAGGSVAPAQPTSLRWNWGIFAQTCSTCLEGPYRKDSSGAHPCRAIDRAWEPRIPSPCSITQLVHNKYNTNYEALRLANLTTLAFNLGKILLKLISTSGWVTIPQLHSN